jgi:hypothetical protein
MSGKGEYVTVPPLPDNYSLKTALQERIPKGQWHILSLTHSSLALTRKLCAFTAERLVISTLADVFPLNIVSGIALAVVVMH